MFTPLTLNGCQLDPRDGRTVSSWTEQGGERRFLLWLSERDAAAIFGATPREGPLTSRLVEALGGDIVCARIIGLDAEGIVLATLVIAQAGAEIVMRAPVADAVAAAHHVGAPIEIRDDLLTDVSRHIDAAQRRAQDEERASADTAVALSTGERWNQLLSHLGPLSSTPPLA